MNTLRIAGYVPCSLLDYPGRIAAVVFTQGCNWRCPWCHNLHLVEPARFGPVLETERVMAHLATRRGKLDGVVVTGGEPTLHGGLEVFLACVHALGFLVKLDTNGSRPAVLRRLLEAGLLDYVAMDVKAPLERYDVFAGVPVDTAAIAESMRLIAVSGVEHEFRTTVVPHLHTEADLAGVRALVARAPRHTLQTWRAPAG